MAKTCSAVTLHFLFLVEAHSLQLQPVPESTLCAFLSYFFLVDHPLLRVPSPSFSLSLSLSRSPSLSPSGSLLLSLTGSSSLFLTRSHSLFLTLARCFSLALARCFSLALARCFSLKAVAKGPILRPWPDPFWAKKKENKTGFKTKKIQLQSRHFPG